jgi:3-hydroxyisobutyrate dehydrogenase
VYAKKARLDLEAMVATISKGAAGCWTLDNLAHGSSTIITDGFFIDICKRLGYRMEEAQKMGLCLPGLALVRQLYIAHAGSRAR